jgi:hypothetical protein
MAIQLRRETAATSIYRTGSQRLTVDLSTVGSSEDRSKDRAVWLVTPEQALGRGRHTLIPLNPD